MSELFPHGSIRSALLATYSENRIEYPAERLNSTPIPPFGASFALIGYLEAAELLVKPPSRRAIAHFEV